MRETVVLIPGVWLPGWSLAWLARRLRATGFRCLIFRYPSVRADLEANVQQLHRFVATLPGVPLHLVGHSLGGVVIATLLERFDDLPPGRVVMLASPLAGSRVARRLSGSALGRRLLGRSLCQYLAAAGALTVPARATGVIAGTRPLGVGRLLAPLPAGNDGTVAVDETRLPGLADHLVLPVSHTSLLFSSEVARQTGIFLRQGRFDRGEGRE